MSDLYNRIETLCRERKVSITTVCKESGASRASLSDLKMGRKQSLSAETLSKLANWFGVSIDYLLGAENAPGESPRRKITDAELKFALFGDCESITDADLADVQRYAAFVRERKKDLK